jgi:hypothetical protein
LGIFGVGSYNYLPRAGFELHVILLSLPPE